MQKLKKKVLLIVIMLILITVSITGFTLAKYVSSSVWNNYLESKGFYFTSKEVNTTSIKNVNKNWDGSSIHFILSNSKNLSLITDYDIEYNVKCNVVSDNSNISCNLMGTNKSTYNGVLSNIKVCSNKLSGYTEDTCKNSGYKWINDVTKKDIYFDIIGNDYTDVTVNIEVNSTKPYKKTLKGEFILHKAFISNGISIKYDDYFNYGNVVITNTTDNDKTILVEFNSNNLKIDNINNEFDNYNVDSNNYINSVIVNVPNNSNKVIKFYKSNKNINYSINDFNISVSE